jgi:uncharacterized protein YecE (DUF72 family)
MLEGWAAKTPEHFRFALKAPQRITHFGRLHGVAAILGHFVETATALGARLGPILFQLPPDFARNDPVLEAFLETLDKRVRAAFEFRHRSWFDSAIFDLLRRYNAALCIAETDTLVTPLECTAPHVYLRLRKPAYDTPALTVWADRIRSFAADADEVYVFFKHEAAAPELAAELARLLSQGLP